MEATSETIGFPPDFTESSSDICKWRISPSEPLSVKKFYEYHRPALQQPLVAEFPYKFVWKSHAPARVKFYIWTACLNKCLTVDNLNKRGKFIVSRCPLCKSALETLAHVLLHCPFSATVWNAFLLNTAWPWHMPDEPFEFAIGWKANNRWLGRGKFLWSIMPIAVWWGLWWERNARTFQRKESTTDQVINHIRCLIYSWAMILPECKDLSLRELAINWDRCILRL